MLVALCLVGALLGTGLAIPVTPDVAEMARNYAARHPNTETEANPEYGDLLEGDIEREEEDLTVSNPLNAIIDTRRHWPNGVAYYTIQNGVYTAEEVRLIEAGIIDLQDLTKVNGEFCIRILPRNNQANYIRVENYSGCSSNVGMVGGGQRLSLVPTCIHNRHGTVMHEFIHAFGFYHEQSRTDRDDWVTINWDNIQPGTENNFAKYSENQITPLGTSYDYGSVMHYGAYGFAIDPDVPTIIPHDPNAEIGQRVTLSQLDIERIQILYKCLDPADSVHFKHLARD